MRVLVTKQNWQLIKILVMLLNIPSFSFNLKQIFIYIYIYMYIQGKVFPNNVMPGMFGLGMVLKEIHLGYSTRFLFREQDLYLETWSWSPLICTEKAFGSGYMGLRERMYFIIFVYYPNIKVFHFIYFSLFFIYSYVSFLLACDQCFV